VNTSIVFQVARQRNRVLDLEIAVDDARTQVDRDVEVLRGAVRERDRGLVHLQHLIEMVTEAA
jgi:hypothetical protein